MDFPQPICGVTVADRDIPAALEAVGDDAAVLAISDPSEELAGRLGGNPTDGGGVGVTELIEYVCELGILVRGWRRRCPKKQRSWPVGPWHRTR